MTREIVITPVLNGFVCKVGCQKVVFQSITDLVRSLEAYYKYPDATEKDFLEKAVNKVDEGPRPVANEACDNVREATQVSIGDALGRASVSSRR